MNVNEAKRKCSGCKGGKGGLWCSICLRRQKGLPRKKPGQKGYPKTLKIESLLRDFVLEAIKSVHKSSVGGFDLNYFKQIKRLPEAIDYATNRLQMVGYGSSRLVFVLTGKTVLKIARNQSKGYSQNEAEVLLSEAGDTGGMVMKVKAYDPEFKWVISEIARPISEKDFEMITSTPWLEHVAWIYGVLMTGSDDKNLIIRKLSDSQLSKIEDQIRGIAVTGETVDEKMIYGVFMKGMSPFTETLVSALINSGAFSPDLTKISSYGKTPSGKICVLDYGYTEWNKDVVLGKVRNNPIKILPANQEALPGE